MTSPTIFTGSPYFHNPTLKNFEPRIGLAWDPFGDGKTSVRGAFGFFDVLPLPAAFSLAIDQSAPFYKFFATGSPQGCQGNPANPADPLQVFPTCVGDPNNNPNVPLTTLQTAFVQFDPPRNYVMIWSLNVERDVSRNTSVMVGYVGNRGVHMLNREDDINSVLPTETSQGILMSVNPGAAPPCTEATLNIMTGGNCKVNPAVGDVRGIYWNGDSFYDALEATLKEKIGSSLNFQTSYTWGKAIDTGSATVIGDPFQTSISSPYFFCKKCRRSLSDFDIRHSLSAHLIYDLPSPKSLGSFGSTALGGWELGTILTAQSGVPFTPIITGDVLGLGSADPWAFPSLVPGCNTIASNPKANPLGPIYYNQKCFSFPLQGSIPAAQCNSVADPNTNQPACLNLFGNVRRNSFIGPKLVDVDFSVYKNFPVHRISESFNVQFRAEMFNILNHTNFGPPINNVAVLQPVSTISTAGLLDRTTTTSRQIQFGLKLSW